MQNSRQAACLHSRVSGGLDSYSEKSYLIVVKRIASILFTAVYLTVVVGVTISIHLCGGVVTAVSANPLGGSSDPCGCTDDGSADACCQTTVSTFQLDNAHTPVVAAEAPAFQSLLIALIPVLDDAPFTPLTLTQSIAEFPFPTHPPAHILNRTLLI